MSNATLSSPWLIVLDLWGSWLFVVGFVKPLTLVVGLVLFVVGFVKPLTLVVGLVLLVEGFVLFLGVKLKVNDHMFKCKI